jgi:hypothetical protein
MMVQRRYSAIAVAACLMVLAGAALAEAHPATLTGVLYMGSTLTGYTKYTISNFSQYSSQTVNIDNRTFTVVDNFITPSTAGVSVNNRLLTLAIDTPVLLLNTTGVAYYIELVGVSYLPIEQTVTLSIYGQPSTANSASAATTNVPSLVLPASTTTAPAVNAMPKTTVAPVVTTAAPATTVAPTANTTQASSTPSSSATVPLAGAVAAIAIAVAAGVAYSRISGRRRRFR